MNQDHLQTPIEEQLIFEAEDFVRILMEKISKAEREILISMYMVENDDFGAKVMGALREKAASGVKVRILLDGFGSWSWIREHLDTDLEKKIDIRIFHPLPFSNPKFSNTQKWKQVYAFLGHLNHRDHHKIFVFDQKTAITGSRNINNDALKWRETSVLFTGPAVTETVSVIENLWKRSHTSSFKRYYYPLRYKIAEPFHYIVTNHVFWLRRKSVRVLREKIRQARSHIYLTTPYFFLPHRILRSLLRKAKEGIDVKILVPKLSDVRLSRWINQIQYKRLLKAGVGIFEYKPKILHAKTLVIDEWVIVATSNFNHRSMSRDFELDYILTKKENIRKIQTHFLEDIKQSTPIITPPEVRPIKKWIAELSTYFFPSWF